VTLSLSRLLTTALLLQSVVGTAWAMEVPQDGALAEQPAIQTGNREPEGMRGVGIDEQLGAQLPLDMTFRNAEGESVQLASLLDQERPLVLTLNYANCPNLCSTQLSGFVDTLNSMEKWQVGKQFQIVTLSLDPNESDELNQAFKGQTLASYEGDQELASQGWHFWRGQEQDVRHIADTVGFRYNTVAGGTQFAHTAVLVLLDPQGKVARYLYGVTYEPSTLRLSLAETAAGKYVSTLDALILKCFLYNAAAGGYTASAWAITKGIMTFLALLLFGLIGWMLVLERRRKLAHAT